MRRPSSPFDAGRPPIFETAALALIEDIVAAVGSNAPGLPLEVAIDHGSLTHTPQSAGGAAFRRQAVAVGQRMSQCVRAGAGPAQLRLAVSGSAVSGSLRFELTVAGDAGLETTGLVEAAARHGAAVMESSRDRVTLVLFPAPTAADGGH